MPNTPEHLRETIAICTTIQNSVATMAGCTEVILDKSFVKFIGECIAWKLDYKNDLGLMKFKSNSQTRRGNNSTDITSFSFTIPVPQTENFCNWRPQ